MKIYNKYEVCKMCRLWFEKPKDERCNFASFIFGGCRNFIEITKDKLKPLNEQTVDKIKGNSLREKTGQEVLRDIREIKQQLLKVIK